MPTSHGDALCSRHHTNYGEIEAKIAGSFAVFFSYKNACGKCPSYNKPISNPLQIDHIKIVKIGLFYFSGVM